MTEWADHALVLRIGHFRESDLWLKMLCRKHGLLTLFARHTSCSLLIQENADPSVQYAVANGRLQRSDLRATNAQPALVPSTE